MAGALTIDVRLDNRAALRKLDSAQASVKRAAAAALNRVGVTARATAAREISKATGMKVSEVKPRVPMIKANRTSLTVILSAKPWSPNLIRFQARQVRAGVSAKAWGQRKVYRGTFIVKGRTVFKRTGKGRLPIEPVHGPSVRREFIRDHTLNAIKDVVRQRFALEFERAHAQFNRAR